MTYRTVSPTRQQGLRDALLEQMTTLVDAVCVWLNAQPRTLAELEQRTQAHLHHLGQALLTGLCAVQVSSYPVATVACRCGGVAQYQRQRAIQVHTLLGRVQVQRPYYLCPACHQGQAPLDAAWGVWANSVSAGLEQVLARLGVSMPFGEAAELAAWLLPVAVSPTTVASATERVGQAIAAAEAQAEATAWNQEAPQPPTTPAAGPERMYVWVDGTMVHLGEEGWKEAKLGTFYITRVHPTKQTGEAPAVRAEQHSFVTDLCDAEAFGRLVWLEADRRGVLQATEVVVIGDGSHWIWNLAAEHFPQAVQIVDWYHASQYVWNAAHACYGEGTTAATAWAEARLNTLWDGEVETVLAEMQPLVGRAEAVQEAITYLTNNRERMRYATFRAAGLQIGSGSIESGCKQVIGARLKQAGMRWSRPGARAVAKARAWCKSGRWEEAMALLSPRQRSYHRKAA